MNTWLLRLSARLKFAVRMLKTLNGLLRSILLVAARVLLESSRLMLLFRIRCRMIRSELDLEVYWTWRVLDATRLKNRDNLQTKDTLDGRGIAACGGVVLAWSEVMECTVRGGILKRREHGGDEVGHVEGLVWRGVWCG